MRSKDNKREKITVQRKSLKCPFRTLKEAPGSYRTPPGKSIADLIEDALSHRVEAIKHGASPVTIWLPVSLIKAVKDKAHRQGISYHNLLKQYIQHGLAGEYEQ